MLTCQRGTACRHSVLEMRLSSMIPGSPSSQASILQVQPTSTTCLGESADTILTCTPDRGSVPTSASVPSCHMTCRTSEDEGPHTSQVTPVGGAGGAGSGSEPRISGKDRQVAGQPWSSLPPSPGQMLENSLMSCQPRNRNKI